MWKMRYYLPLVGFILPTLAIGYGLVIPRSCIAGVNELSVGFGSTVFGAMLTYFAGIRTATATSCPARVPWRVRFARYVNRQASHPRGLFGRLLGVIWKFEHRKLNTQTLDLLDIRATDRVLDVGCGPGVGVREAAGRAPQGHVTGLDVSSTMVAIARRRNRRAIRLGRVDITRLDVDDLGLAPESLDRIFSVHCIYFWKDPSETLRQLTETLRPSGRLVLAFRPDGADVPARFRDATYRFYTPTEVETMLRAAGFQSVRLVTPASGTVLWVVAERQS
jgi:SAM-dependent methyltransferase